MCQPPAEELRQRAAEVRFGAAQCGLTILRYLTDHAPRLSLSVLARIVSAPPCPPVRACEPCPACAPHTKLCGQTVGAPTCPVAAPWMLSQRRPLWGCPWGQPAGTGPGHWRARRHLSLDAQVSTNDAALTLLPLLERPPWVRRGRGGAVEKFIGGGWQAVPPEERHRLTQQDGQVGWAGRGRLGRSGPSGALLSLLADRWLAAHCLQHMYIYYVLPVALKTPHRPYATIRRTRSCAAHPWWQVWLALHNLLADSAARSRMDMTEGRVEALLRLKRHFNELLLDQAGGGCRWRVLCAGRRFAQLRRQCGCRRAVSSSLHRPHHLAPPTPTHPGPPSLQLPVLRNLQRVIDELAFGVNTAQAVAGPSGRLIVEQVGIL